MRDGKPAEKAPIPTIVERHGAIRSEPRQLGALAIASLALLLVVYMAAMEHRYRKHEDRFYGGCIAACCAPGGEPLVCASECRRVLEGGR